MATTPAALARPRRYNYYEGGFNNTSDPRAQMEQNRMRWAGKGDAVQDQTSADAADYKDLEGGYREQADTAFNDLNDQPGFDPELEGQINQDYSQFNTSPQELAKRKLSFDEEAGIRGNPQFQREALDPGMLEDIDRTSALNQGNATGALQTGLRTSYNPDRLRTSDARGQATGEAIGSEESQLNDINDPNKLGVSDEFKNAYRMSDADKDEIITGAGRTVGNQYRTAEDSLVRDAAADGNASPAAVAAGRARLLAQSAAGEGDAMSNARIAAGREQADREAGIEDRRLGAEGDIATRRANAATTVGGQRIEDANTGEKLRMSGEQDVADRNFEAERIGGQAGIDTAVRTGDQQASTARYSQAQRLGVEQNIDEKQADREAAIATNRQNTDKGIQDTQFNQGTTSAQNTSEGAQTVGTARIAGRTAYRNHLTGQQASAQQGAQTSTGQQIQALGTEGSLVNEATGQKGRQDTAQSQTNQNKVSTVLGAFGLADGGVVTEPGEYTVGEDGPEEVISMSPDSSGTFVSPEADRVAANTARTEAAPTQRGPNKLQRGLNTINRYRDMISKPREIPLPRRKLVTRPTRMLLGENGPDAVVPLNHRSGAKLTPGMLEGRRRYSESAAY